MDSGIDLNFSRQTVSTDSANSSLDSNELCFLCTARLHAIDSAYEELRRQHCECPYCDSLITDMNDVSSPSSSRDADEEDNGSTEYGTLNDFYFNTYGFDVMQNVQFSQSSNDTVIEEPLAYTAEEQTISDLRDEQTYQPFDEEDDHQIEDSNFCADHSEMPRYPERSTRSDIASYYETPLRSRFWTKRRSNSRARR